MTKEFDRLRLLVGTWGDVESTDKVTVIDQFDGSCCPVFEAYALRSFARRADGDAEVCAAVIAQASEIGARFDFSECETVRLCLDAIGICLDELDAMPTFDDVPLDAENDFA